MNCIIIEDQAPAQRILKRYISDISTLELRGTFTNALSAMQFLENEKVDLIFLDIHLPKISGLEFLRSLPDPPAVILTTAFPDYAVQSYEFNVVDYLVKPFSFERFVKAINKLSRKIDEPSASRSGELNFFIKSGYEYIKINSADILFIKSDMDYTEINLPDKKHLTQETLSYWQEKLGPGFFRVHRSYLINTTKILKVSGNQVFLPVENTIPIGRAYKEEFFAKFVR